VSNVKYLVWNNIGGVGKTFLTYMLSVEYAIKNPSEDVIVIDACPQSNVSEMLLGGNGQGEENLEKFRRNNLTIAGYIKDRYERSRSSKIGTETNYFLSAHAYNAHMPVNLYLLPGDVDLDICSSIINYLGTAPERGAWKKSRHLLCDLVESFESRKDAQGRKQVFFIDCNPSFANYTEMAVLAATRILVPCTADAASIRGIRNLFKLIYGIPTGPNEINDEVFLMFSSNARDAGLNLPLVHRFVQNKSRTNLADASSAFKAHVHEIQELASNMKKQHPRLFTSVQGREVLNVKDGNTLATIINHIGQPLTKLQQKKYQIYDQDTQANNSQIEPLVKDIMAVLDTL
jgi:cellulose biosynthesis protein BcsQ